MIQTLNQTLQGAYRANINSIQDNDHLSLRGHNLRFAPAMAAGDVGGSGIFDVSRRIHRQRASDWAESTTMVTDLLGEPDIVLGLSVKGKRSALAKIAAWLGPKAGVSQGSVLAALLRRERLGSTAVGHGVAIPHARLDGIAAPKIMLATLKQPVWFGAPDNDPVDLLLAVLWPKSNSVGFLPALARFCRLLRHRELRDRILAAASAAEALAWIGLFEQKQAEPHIDNSSCMG